MEIDHTIAGDEQLPRDQLLLHEELSEKIGDLREARIKSLHEMEELKTVQDYECRLGKIRDEEKMLAVKKLIPESLQNNRFRGTTVSYGELIIALENIIVDKVSTVPSSKSRKNHTSAPMEVGMAAKEDGENVSQAGDQRIVDLALQAVYKGTGKGKWGFGKGQNWNEEGGKGGKDGGKNSWQKGSGRERRQRARERWQGRIQNVLDVWQDRANCSLVQERGKQTFVRR